MANQQQYWLFEVFGTDPDAIGFFGDAGIIIPRGTTAERPTPPVEGHLRLNTDSKVFEGFFDGLWQDIGAGGGGGGTFIGLSDTPGVYVGNANRVLKVGSTETGVEFSPNLEIEPGGRIQVPIGYESLVDADTVLTNKKYVNDQDNLQLSLSGGVMTGSMNAGSFPILGLPVTPTVATEAASKAYVDQIASGIDFKESVHMGTVANLPATYDNGTAGLGATLTATTPGVLPPTITDDHAHFVVGTRILVKDQTDATENGIFEYSTIGSGEEVTQVIVVGDTGDSLDGTYWTFNDGATSFYVWYDTPAGGGDPTPGGTGIPVSIATNEFAAVVKALTLLAISGSAALATAFNDEIDTFFLVNDNTGVAADSTAGTSGFGVSTTLQGTGTPTPWILTRTTDADNSPTNEVSGGMFTFVEDGATLASTGWVLAEPQGDAVLGVDDLVFTVISGAGGAFLPLAGGIMTGTITMGSPGIQVLGDVAVAAAPAFSFLPDPGTGLHQVSGPGTLSVLIGTTPKWEFTAGALLPSTTLVTDIGAAGAKVKDVYADHFYPNFGTVGDPSYSFEGATTTGMYNNGAGGIRFAIGGVNALNIESDGTISVDTASYETLVLAANDVPNKKYVDDLITAITSIVDDDLDTRIEVDDGADDDTIRMDVGDTPVGYGAVTDIFVLNSAGFAIAMGTPTSGGGVVGAPISLAAGNGGAEGGVGGLVSITSGIGTSAAAGGAIDLTTGKGGATGAGGDISLLGGEGGGTSGAGGNISLTGGAADGGGAGGAVDITAGAGASAGGDVTITAGASTGADEGGDVNIDAGAAGATGTGGDITLTASAGGATSGTGGDVTLNAGAAITTTANSDGGAIRLNTSRGRGTGDGGSIFLDAGFAGSQSGAAGGSILMDAGFGNTLGVGGNVRISGGTGGSGDGVSGGFIRIEGGNAGSSGSGGGTNWSGGDVRLRGAGGVGTGTSGAVILEPLTGTTTGVDASPTQLRFQEEILSGTNYVGFIAPSTIGTNVIWTLPATDSTNTQSLVSDGAGNLSWSDLGGSGISDEDGDTKVQTEESGADDDIIRFDTGDTGSPGYGAIEDIMTLASSGWTVAMGTATGTTTPGAPISLSAGIGGTEGGGDGGNVTVNSGDAGTGSAGDGGDIILNVGSGDGAGAPGSVIMQSGGATFMTFAAGSGTITTPDGANRDFDITAGDAVTTTNPGGVLSLTAGVGGTSAGGDGGAVVVTAGDAGTASAGDGGDIELRPGAADGAGEDGIVSIIGASTGAAGELRLEDDAGGEYIGLQAASVIASSFTLTLPSADATGTQALFSDGAGTLSFQTVSTTGIVDADGDTQVQVEESADEDIIRFDTGDSPTGFGAVTDIMTLASSGWTVAMGTANATVTDGAPISITAGTGNTTGYGGDIDIKAGSGGTLAKGGSVDITGGQAFGAGTASGSVTVSGGYSGNATSLPGQALLIGGAGAQDGVDGADAIVRGGRAFGAGGAGNGGDVVLQGGTEAGSGVIGNVLISTGQTDQQVELRFMESSGAGLNYVGFKAPVAITGNQVWELPGADSTGTQALFSDGSGVLSFQTVSTTGIVDADGDTSIQVDDGADDDTIRFDTGLVSPANGYPAVTDIMTMASSAWTVAMGTANVAATAGAPISLTAGIGNTTGAGGAVDINAGASGGGATGNGGAVTINSGASAATNGIGGEIDLTAGAGVGTGAGGTLDFNAGAGGATGTGGNILMNGGLGGATSGTGGTIALYGGDASGGTSAGGTARLRAGASTLGAAGGQIDIDAGASTGTGAGGIVTINAGAGGTGANGGAVVVTSGAGTTTGSGGIIELTVGLAGVTGDGGDIDLLAGAGGATSGAGGDINHTAGKGGAIGAGGAATFRAGDGGTTSGAGGTATLRGGDADGSGAGGDADVTAGAGASAGGVVNITAGDSTGVDAGGPVNITAGNSTGGGSAAGGSININAGSPSTSGDGGSVTLTPTVGTGAGSDGQIFSGIDGSATAPAFSFTNDPTIGLYNDGTNPVVRGLSGVILSISDGSRIASMSNGNTGALFASQSSNLTLQAGSALFSETKPSLRLIDNSGLILHAADGVSASASGNTALIEGGDAGATSGDGGAVNLVGGAASGSGDGGSVTLTPGAGAGVGAAGNVILDAHTWPTADGSTGEVLSTNGSGILSFVAASAIAGSRFTLAFDDGDLTAGVLTVTHSLGTKFNHVTVYNNSDNIIIPTEVNAVGTSSATVDLTGAQTAEGGSIPGTWNVVVSS